MSDWSLSMTTGGKPEYLPHSSTAASVISQDGRYNIVTLSHQLRVYFISTRQCIRSIDVDLAYLVDVKLDPSNPSQVLLFKSYGEMLTVNWKDKIAEPIVSKVALDLEAPLLSVISIHDGFYYVITGNKSKKTGIPARYIEKISIEQRFQLAQVDNTIHWAVSLDASKVVFVTSDHEVHLYDFNYQDDSTTAETLGFPYKSAITSLAVSNDSIIAIGTSSGVIQVVYGGLEIEKPQRILKWHVDIVRALHFSSDNNYLLSGGVEKVLVFWQLETDKTQFLPRLNGSIEKIAIDTNKNDLYTLLLKVSTNSSDEDNYEVLVLSAVDLVSRLAVNTIRPKFSSPVKASLAKAKKRFARLPDSFDKSKLRNDYSCLFEIHPKTKHAYFPNDSVIQAYDLVRNEQAFVQNAAPLLTTGKVRSEAKLIDPVISLLSFTQDGEWMCTFDSVSTSEIDNLLSKNDTQYALKFWKFIELAKGDAVNNQNKTGYWELSTKIIDPHGNSNPILAVIPAPVSYHSGLAFLTADNKGGLRTWRPRIPKEIYQQVKNGQKLQQTAWTMRKSRPSGVLASSAVDICWSEDSSIIFLGHESSIFTIDAQTFEELPNRVPSLSGSPIRSLLILDNKLIVLSKTRISAFNLLSGELTELVAKVNTTTGAKNTIAIDSVNKLVCLAVNYYDTESEESGLGLRSKLLVFKPDQLKPIHVSQHHTAIGAVRHFNSSFVFVDLDTRVGILQPSSPTGLSVFESNGSAVHDLADDMSNILLSAQATADTINNRSINVANNNHVQTDVDDTVESHRVIDLHTLQPIFENTEGIQIDTLFDRIIKVIK